MKRIVHYVLSSHWDREWHHSFQDFRYRLVRLFDHLLAGWENGTLQGPFQTDGQAIVIEDYLEVRPERRARIEELARQGRLVVGPWYVMPDEFNVSGEALIRNLHLGRQVARSLGAQPSAAGFVCDIFGHVSQLPQIFAGFGIRGGFVWRGTNTHGKRNLIWCGADGTRLVCYRFGDIGYCTFAAQVRGAFGSEQPNYELEEYFERLDRSLDDESSGTDVDSLLLLDGGDHQDWDEASHQRMVTRMGIPDERFTFVHSSLDAFLEDLVSQQDRIQTMLNGELREPGLEITQPGEEMIWSDQQWLIPGVLSSRVRLKQANNGCQALLCHWAEPFTAMASVFLGDEYPQGYLNLAWRWLLQNHPHDSIDGCSIDQVHRDMRFRFDQSRMIAERQVLEATHRLAASISQEIEENELRVVVFNSQPKPIDEVFELYLSIPANWPSFNEFFGFEPKPAFRIYDADGKELPYQRLAQDMNRTQFRMRDVRFPEATKTHHVRVALRLALPAMGYRALLVKAGYSGEITRHPQRPGLADSECSMQNDFLRVEIQPNGTLTLTDRRSGESYQRLLTFEDGADIGDGWYHGQAVNDQVFLSTASSAAVALLQDGPCMTTFRVRVAMKIPTRFDFPSMTRAVEFVDLVVDNLVTLRQGQDRVEIHTVVENNALDHRLRALFPSGAQAQTYLADGQFDVLERPIALRADNHLYRELEVETRPQQSWTAVFDERRGLAVISRGLNESAVRDLPERPVALTLLRGTRRTVGTDGEPDGQEMGRLEFDTWLMPLSGEPDRARLTDLGQRITTGVRTVCLQSADQEIYRGEAELPVEASFLRLEGPAILTCLRQVDGRLEARLYNPGDADITVRLDFSGWPEDTQRPKWLRHVDFESNPLSEALELTAPVQISPKKIVTFQVS
jgi:hypothetical protein